MPGPLLNFEALLTEEFGDQFSLNESLAVSLQFSAITPKKKAEALRTLQSKNYPSVMEYVKRFRSALTTDIVQSMEYSFRVFLLPKIGNHANSSDLAVEFINVDNLSVEDMSAIERLVGLIKTRETPVANPGKLRPSDVAHKVEAKLGYRFRTSDHTVCRKFFEVRPETAAAEPKRTNVKFCQYDMPHKGLYLY